MSLKRQHNTDGEHQDIRQQNLRAGRVRLHDYTANSAPPGLLLRI